MRKTLTLAWLIAACVMPLGLRPAVAGETRPLYVFSPSASDERLARQSNINAAAAGGFRDRDMTVTVVTGNSVSGSGRSAGSLRARFGIGPAQFRVILVGKDGGVKLSSGAPVSSATLYQVIDAMPMRRDEMRQRGR